MNTATPQPVCKTAAAPRPVACLCGKRPVIKPAGQDKFYAVCVDPERCLLWPETHTKADRLSAIAAWNALIANLKAQLEKIPS